MLLHRISTASIFLLLLSFSRFSFAVLCYCCELCVQSIGIFSCYTFFTFSQQTEEAKVMQYIVGAKGVSIILAAQRVRDILIRVYVWNSLWNVNIK
jgi:hypothetical protein